MIDVRYAYSFLQNLTLEAHSENYFEERSLSIKHFNDCYGFPYKILQRGEENIMGGGLKVTSGLFIGTAYECASTPFKEITGDVIYAGFISSLCWGHTITDSLSRLWWLGNSSYVAQYQNLPIYYFSESPLEGNYVELLEFVGISKDRLHRINSITHFQSVYVPDVCFDNHRTSLRYNKDYISIIDKVIGRCLAISRCSISSLPKKIFLIKENSKRQICNNEIILTLEKQGYISIHPEKLSVQSQISLMQNADTIVSEESSLSHNFIFCKEGTKVVILRKANTINKYQALINLLKNLNVVYIDCHLSVYNKQQHRGPFFLYANKNFCKYFQRETPPFPYEDFLSYLKNECGTNILDGIHQVDSNYKEIIAELIGG